VTTFMVYVDGQCEGGGTEFPRLRMPDQSRRQWCKFLECEENEVVKDGSKTKMGITFKPKKGNAVFWENIRPDGRGYEETWHAALPVISGTKVGLNIWTWGPARIR
jgi:prolyl 4-hydroxylase